MTTKVANAWNGESNTKESTVTKLTALGSSSDKLKKVSETFIRKWEPKRRKWSTGDFNQKSN